MHVILNILIQYGKPSSQRTNFDKSSIMFSPNVPDELKNRLFNMSNIQQAMANYVIEIVFDATNGDILSLAFDSNSMIQQVNSNMLPYYLSSNIAFSTIDNEVMIFSHSDLIQCCEMSKMPSSRPYFMAKSRSPRCTQWPCLLSGILHLLYHSTQICRVS